MNIKWIIKTLTLLIIAVAFVVVCVRANFTYWQLGLVIGAVAYNFFDR